MLAVVGLSLLGGLFWAASRWDKGLCGDEHRHLITRHTHPEWHGHCLTQVLWHDGAIPPEYMVHTCSQVHWHFWWKHSQEGE